MKLKAILMAIGMAALVASGPAQAACYADYKAKKDSPLQLHYGVMQLPNSACSSRSSAANAIAGRLASQGWTLLNVLSLFDQGQLEGKRASAGSYFLRF